MRKVLLTTSAVYFSLSVFAVATDERSQTLRSGSEVERAQIQQLNDQFARAFNQGDYKQIENMYAEDAVILPPGENQIRGKDQIGNYWRNASQQFGDANVQTQDVRQIGSNALREIGTFSLRVKNSPSQASQQQNTNMTTTSSSSRSQNMVSDMGVSPNQEISGKYVVIWEKEGNTWKLGTDIWNSNSNR